MAATLRETEIAGKAFEFFNESEIDKPWLRGILQAPPNEPFVGFAGWRDYILEAGTGRTGVFGACVHWFQLANAVAAFGPADSSGPAANAPIQTLRAFFPELRLIWLRRQNVVAQAISHYVAIVTGVWSLDRAAPDPQAPVDRNAPYDFAAIDWQVQSAIVASRGWRSVLAPARDLTLALTYEELSADLAGSARRVLDHLGLNLGEAPMPAAPMRKQAGAWSRALERRYREERRERGLPPIEDAE